MLFETLIKFLVFHTFIVLGQSPYGDVSCAAYIPTGYIDGGFVIGILNATFNGNPNNIYNQLYSNAVSIFSSGTVHPSAISDLTFDIPVSVTDEPVTGTLYESEGIKTTVSNFSMVGMTLFVPSETGDYTFSIDDVSDGGAIFIFNDPSIYCCGSIDYIHSLEFTTKVYNIPDDPEHTSTSQTVHLVKDLGYLIMYSYINLSGNAIFKPTVTLPSGQKVADMKGYIKASVSDFICGVGHGNSTLVSQGTDSYTTTFSTSISTKYGTGFGMLPYTEYETIYYVLTPERVSSTAESSAWLSSTAESSSVISSDKIIISSEDTLSKTISSASSSISTPPAIRSSASDFLPSSIISDLTESSKFSSSSKFTSSTITSSIIAASSSEISFPLGLSISSTSMVSTISSTIKNTMASSSYENLKFLNSSTTSQLTSHYKSSSPNDIVSVTKSTDKILETSNKPISNSIQSKVTKQTSTRGIDSGIHLILSTSTFTDEYGVTRTTIVDCSTESQKTSTNSNMNFEDLEESSTYIEEEGQRTVSVKSISHEPTGHQSSEEVAINVNSKTYGENQLSAKNTVSSSPTVVVHETSLASSSAVMIQESPNGSSNGSINSFN
ncbi:hypothetical protein C6P45_003215, partial [Maudiozyma exigua]